MSAQSGSQPNTELMLTLPPRRKKSTLQTHRFISAFGGNRSKSWMSVVFVMQKQKRD